MARDMVQEDIEADETTALNTTSDHDSSSSYGALNKLASTTDDENFVATDPQRSGSPETREPDDRRISGNVWGVISVLLLGEFVANADTTIIFASAGRIASEFDRLPETNWLLTAYNLGFCAGQPIYGKLSDIYGRKVILSLSYTIFAAACILCGVGRELWQIILGRAITGLGGAGMVTMAAVIITDVVPKREVATWRAYVNIAMTLGRAAGGPVGGILTDWVGWRWLFLGQAPLIALAALLVSLKLKTPTHVVATDAADESTTNFKWTRIDFTGMFLLSLAVISTVLLLDLGGQKLPWLSLWTIGLGVAAIILFVAFVLVEAYVAREPIFALHIIRKPNVLASYLVMTLQIIAQVGMMYTIPLYFQITSRASASVAGAHLVPAVVGNALAGLAAGAIVNRTGGYKALIVSAGVIASVTYVLLLFFWNGHTNFWESLYILPGGIGTGLAQAGVFVSMTAKLEPDEIAMATGGFFLFTNFGISTTITANNAALEIEFRKQLEQNLTGDGAAKIIKRILSDVTYINSLHGHLRDVVVAAYVSGLKHTYILSLICSLAASTIALTIRNHPLS